MYTDYFRLGMFDVAWRKRSMEAVMYANCLDASHVRLMLVCGLAWIVNFGGRGGIVGLCWVGCAGLDGIVCYDGTHASCGPRLSAFIMRYGHTLLDVAGQPASCAPMWHANYPLQSICFVCAPRCYTHEPSARWLVLRLGLFPQSLYCSVMFLLFCRI